MSSRSSESSITMDELAQELEEIESKYTPKVNKKCPKISVSLHESLAVLSKEFDCLGLPMIDSEKSVPEILEQVVNSSRDLVQIHRNAVNHIKDKNVESVSRDHKHKELNDKIDKYKDCLERLRDSCISLKNGKTRLQMEIKELKECESAYKDELKQVKRVYLAREQLLEHRIQKLTLETERLKEICGKDIVSETSKNEVALKLLKKHKVNEEIYKSTINTLQENNRGLLDEILSLKEEIILLRAEK